MPPSLTERAKRTRSDSTGAEEDRKAKKTHNTLLVGEKCQPFGAVALIRKHSFAAQSMITILVGNEQIQYNVHAEVLSAHSTVLKEEVGDLDKTTEIKPILINDVSEETFNTFMTWIYAKKLATDGVLVTEMDDADESDDGSSVASNEDGDADDKSSIASNEVEGTKQSTKDATPDATGTSIVTSTQETEADVDNKPWDAELNRAGRVFGRLVDAFIFAARYDCSVFRRAVVLQLQRCIDKYNRVPCPTVVKRALDHLHLDAPLCRYLVIAMDTTRTTTRCRALAWPLYRRTS